MSSFSTVLVANRGEIAERVIRTAKAMGYETVAVYSDADRDARHVQAADKAVRIGPAAVADSYLNIDSILAACDITGAGAVHPGYGFLSENTEFSKACEEKGIVFIGPPADAIELMGSKRLSKIAMQQADVPCVPGYEGSDKSDNTLLAEAERIGFPLMVKASAGGGGRGMRLVHAAADLPAAIKTARSEAKTAFGSDELILEKAIINPRHVEIQVFADQAGNTVYIGERDCSVQRRHQKVVEESPSPIMTDELRAAMGNAAVNAAKACGYVGAGTVEFLVDESLNFYFLEMNTRLQVEHPVTEMVSGFDLVQWQLNVAAGQPLPVTQEQIQLQGHAVEVRFYAEDPANGFLPQTGTVQRWRFQESTDVRFDHGIIEGQEVSSFYDPMLAKIIAHGANRDEALRKAVRALKNTRLFGVKNNKTFLINVLQHKTFQQGKATTAFIEQDFADDDSMQQCPPSNSALAIAATVLMSAEDIESGAKTPAFSTTGQLHSQLKLACAEQHYPLAITRQGTDFTVATADNPPVTIEVLTLSDEQLVYHCDGVRASANYLLTGEKLYLDLGDGATEFDNITHRPPAAANEVGSGKLLAPMNASVVTVDVSVGDRVSKGQVVAILDAMKIEHQLLADVDGAVVEVNAAAGDQVKNRQLIVRIEADEASVTSE